MEQLSNINEPNLLVIKNIMSEIKIIDYRNARYQGQFKDDKFHGVGIILNDDFTFCLATWNQNCFDGPAMIVLPDQKIFYGEFRDGQYDGFCCYQMGKQCQVYCLAKNGQIQSPVAAVFPLISCVINLSLSSGEQVSTSEESMYGDEHQKWELINSILALEIPEYYRNIRKFMKTCIMGNSPYLQEINGKNYSVGFKDGGLRAMISLEDMCVKELGIYNEANILFGMGKKVINRERGVRQEGMYDELDGLERYQQRPKHVKKRYRDFFRKSLDYENKFIRLSKIEEIEEYFNRLKISINDNTTKRIAQQLLQNPNPIPNIMARPAEFRERSADRNKRENQASLEKLQEQLNKSRNYGTKARSRSKSPYQQMESAPAELKYTSNSIAKNVMEQYTHSHAQNRDRPRQYYQREGIEQNYSRQYQINHRDENRSRSPIRYEKSYKNYNDTPIRYTKREEEMKRLNPQYNTYEERNERYGVMDKGRDIERERTYHRNEDKFPEKIYSNIELKPQHYHNTSNNNRRSPTKLDKMSSLYDQIQQDDGHDRSRRGSRNTNNRNYLKREYHLHDDEDMFERKMGLAQPSRKLQYNPHYNSPSKSKSPIRNQDRMPFKVNREMRDDRVSGYVHYRNRP